MPKTLEHIEGGISILVRPRVLEALAAIYEIPVGELTALRDKAIQIATDQERASQADDSEVVLHERTRVGTALVKARQRKGWSTIELSRATGLNFWTLEALEDEDVPPIQGSHTLGSCAKN